ncbi:MAG: metallophosphatase domain-containing protein [Planctomycetota bacterium]
MRLVCLSDTHSIHGELTVPDGDVLIHAGDLTGHGTPAEIEAFGAFLAGLLHSHKVVIAGNHDFLFESDRERAEALLGDVTFLQDEGATVEGLEIWGSPWQPWFHDWAFNLQRGAALAEKWALIPDRTDVLVTHGPPRGVLDRTRRGERVGCDDLLVALDRVRPALHLFGHIHESRGAKRVGETLHVNASCCSLGYEPIRPPIVIDWDADGPSVVPS